MKLHEYQGKEILRQFGVNVQEGKVARTPDEVRQIAREFGQRAAAECSPIDDHRSTASYRRHAVAVLVERLLLRANDHQKETPR